MEAKADAIRYGMTGEQVLAVLGRGPDVEADWIDPATGEHVEGGWRCIWYSREGTVAVDFDGEGKVRAVRFVPLARGQRGGPGP
ncbi:MAG TPA: hypothetical protein VEL76_28185 [Gemmataceae bacterium]|nr:hypothetical protein [Gemmataceae bacterium]